ncbi:hypothetical protein ACFY05_32810 [Microtetraspora fusca]|uniref:Uncharacterized protein n=1 Tax=Microtetraspora fusca TaxID=1997 RepID=A0ABW6VE50_MICFU
MTTITPTTKPRRRRNSPRPPHLINYRTWTLVPYLEKFLADGWTVADLAEVTKVETGTIAGVLDRSITILNSATAKALQHLTTEQLLSDGTGPMPIRLTAWKLGSLYAAGHTTTELARRLEQPDQVILDIIHRRPAGVPRDLAADIDVLFGLLEDIPGPSPAAAAVAAGLGWRIPDEYSPDGRLWDDFDPAHDEVRAEREAEATTRLEVLRMTIRLRYTASRIGRELGIPKETARSYRDGAGVLVTSNRTYAPGTGDPYQSLIDPRCAVRVKQICRVLDQYETFRELDPFLLVQSLGLMQDERWQVDGKPKLVTAA